jgi:cytoskeletal protein CcmA (bactofilin family)
MFSSKSKEPAQVPAPPVPAQASQKRVVRPASAPSIISSDLVVNGTLTSVGDIQIDGHVEGDVRSAGLIVGEKAVIHGEVLADDVTVRGRIEGGVRARKVLLCSTCHVEGNILHEAFAVETGAFFEGNCRHSDNPLAEEVAPRKPAAEYASRPTPAAPISAATPSNAPTSPVATVARPLGDISGGAGRPASPGLAVKP